MVAGHMRIHYPCGVCGKLSTNVYAVKFENQIIYVKACNQEHADKRMKG